MSTQRLRVQSGLKCCTGGACIFIPLQHSFYGDSGCVPPHTPSLGLFHSCAFQGHDKKKGRRSQPRKKLKKPIPCSTLSKPLHRSIISADTQACTSRPNIYRHTDTWCTFKVCVNVCVVCLYACMWTRQSSAGRAHIFLTNHPPLSLLPSPFLFLAVLPPPLHNRVCAFICMVQLALGGGVLWPDKCSITGGTSYHGGRLIQTIREADNGNWVPVFQTSYRPRRKKSGPCFE